MRVGSLVYATEQGLGILAKSFYDHGVVTDPCIVSHSKHLNHLEWYLGTPVVHDLRRCTLQLQEFCRSVDVMLFFETTFDWTLPTYCRSIGVKTVMMPMYECFVERYMNLPFDLFLCPSLLDLSYFHYEGKPGYPLLPEKCKPGVVYRGVYNSSVCYLPVPVEVPWRRRTRAEVFIHNAGHGGLRGRNGTKELLEALQYVESPIKLILRAQSHNRDTESIRRDVMLDDERIQLRIGNFPYETLWDDGDVFVFPEKFNGLSLPLQEASAAGMLVIGTDRFPMNEWLPTKVVCPACDGEGSLMYEWGKAAMMKVGGSRRPLSDSRDGFFYVDADGREIGLKTIGGNCSMCRGSGKVNPLIEPAGDTYPVRVGPPYLPFHEAILNPQAIAAKIDEWYGRDITDYSLSGKVWAETMSWEALGPKYLELLEGLL